MDLKRNIEDFDLIFLDLETTGLDAVTGDAICEVGAFKVRGRKKIDKFHSLVNPKKDIPREAYLIHKISNIDLKDAPSFAEITDRLLLFLSGGVICAYNAGFDMNFLNYELKRVNQPPVQLPAIDVLAMARKTLHLPRYHLAAIASFFKLTSQGSHRALDDAEATRQVFFKLAGLLRNKGIERLEDFLSLYGFDNSILKSVQEPKLSFLNEAIAQGAYLKMRYFSKENTLEEETVKPVNIYQERKDLYLCYQNRRRESPSISLDHILEVKQAQQDIREEI